MRVELISFGGARKERLSSMTSRPKNGEQFSLAHKPRDQSDLHIPPKETAAGSKTVFGAI